MAETQQHRTNRTDYRNQRNQFLSEYRGNQIMVPATFSTPDILRIYRRHFDAMSRAVFFMRFHLRVIDDANTEAALIKEIVNSLSTAEAQVRQKIEIADRLLADCTGQAKAQPVAQLEVAVIDPLANRYLQLILVADQLAARHTALWIALALEDQEYRKANNELEKRLRQLRNQLTTISLGVRKRVNQMQAIDVDGPAQPDVDLDEAGQALADTNPLADKVAA
jgi:hypothetical protein